MKSFLRIVRRSFILGCLLFLAACSEKSSHWSLYDVTGHLPDLAFNLTAAGGKTFTQENLKGRTVLLFFGYASCPDICPTTMAQLTQVIQDLGSEAENVRIVFISVDPHRDTPDMLQAYVDAFNKNAIGLTGNEEQIAELAKRYRIAYQIEKPKPGDDPKNYDVTHSRGVFIFDNAGRARLLASDTEQTQAVTQDIRQLLKLTASGAKN